MSETKSGGYTPDNHPNRDVKPDDWMLRNMRQTLANIAPLYAQLDSGKATKK